MHEMILILDFGSQYTQLIARRIRELNVYCEIHPWNKIPEIGANVKGVILSGSPFSVRDEASPRPIYLYLAICLVGILLFLLIKKFYKKLNLRNG